MLEGSLIDKIVLFALPLAASSILQQLFNAADLAVVGRFASARAMAAAGSNASVINLLVGVFVGLSVGANVLVATMIGSGHREKVNEAVHTIYTIALCSGVFLIFFGMLLSVPILHMMSAPEDVMELAVLYLRIYFLSMPAIMVFNFGSAILRSKGDSTRPLIALLLSGVINVILNLIFVILFHLHVIGVASATVISNYIGAGMVTRFLLTEEESFRLNFRRLGIKWMHLKRIIRIGLPAGMQGAVFSLSNVVIQSAVNSFGANAIAGSAAAANFDFLSYYIINAFAQSAITFTGQNYAARKYDRCRKVFRITLLCGGCASFVTVVLFVVFRYRLISLFTTDEAVIGFAMRRIMNCFILHYLISTYEITGGCLRGMGYGMVPTVISIAGTCLFRLVYIFTYFRSVHTFEALFHVYPYSWILTGILTLTAYFLIRKKHMPLTSSQ